MDKKPNTNKKEENKDLKKNKFKELQEIVKMKKQQSISNELDEVIHEQEKRKNQREGKTPIQMLIEKEPEKFKERLEGMSMEDVAKFSMLLNSENAKEYSEYVKTLRDDNRFDYLEKRIDFLEKLILEKL